jgi:hypothetical protein
VGLSADADRVRLELRNAGFQEWESGRRGFFVEADFQGGWVSVTCLAGFPGARTRRNRDLQKYRDILSAVGFKVTDSPYVQGVLRVTLPPDSAEGAR